MQYLVPLWKHQLEAVERAKTLDYFALFFDCGTGKTATAINILRHKYEAHGRLLRTLILCPQIVVHNWKEEFNLHSHVPPGQVIGLVGPGKKRQETLQRLGFDPLSGAPKNLILITNYESLLMEELYSLLMNWAPEALVVDESHRCKDVRAKRTKRLVPLADAAKYRYILTGTPILNSPLDIFAQYRVLDQGRAFGKNFFAFRATYFYDANAQMPRHVYFPKWVIRPSALEQISEKLKATSMYAKKEECLDLPPLVKQTILVDLLPEQRRVYEDLKEEFIAYIQGGACVATMAVTKALRLQQVVSGYVPVVRDDSQDQVAVDFEDNPRLMALKELLEDLTPQHKVIVWAVFRQNYAQIRKLLEKMGLQYVEVHGDVSDRDKEEAVRRFNHDGECRVFVGHPRAGGIGINLTVASYSIFYSRGFSLEDDLQAESRNHRGGSERHKNITRIDLVAPGTIDELILKRLANKEEIGEKVLKDIAYELREVKS